MKKEEQAVNEIMDILGAEKVSEKKNGKESPRDITAEACSEVTLQSSMRKELALLNAAIESMENLKPDMFDNGELCNACADHTRMLRDMRCRRYEHMVDWAAIAKGEA